MLSKLRPRTVLPIAVVGFVAVVGLLMLPVAAQASTHTQNSGGTTPATNPDVGYGVPPGTPGSPISYSLPPSSYIAPGRILFEQNCASCHGTLATGSSIAPDLQGLGAGTIDFWLSTGRMPLANSSESAVEKPSRFTRTEMLQMVAFVNSLQAPSAGLPAIPNVDLSGANLENGNALFVLNCAACHTITGSGDAIAGNNYAPSLHNATATQAVEAMRSGPGNMPRFGPGTLTDQQVADIVAYVTGPIEKPANHGGLGLGGIGPVAEGFIALLIGVGGLMLAAYWLGDRTPT